MHGLEFINMDVHALERLLNDPAGFERWHQLGIGSHGEEVRRLAEDMRSTLQATHVDPKWSSYLAVDKQTRQVVGSCCFKGAPSADGVVEIAYFTFPALEGRGYASSMAARLVDLAFADKAVRRVIAHTPPEHSDAVQMLEKNGFHLVGEVTDSQGAKVWAWAVAKRSYGS